MKWGFGPVVVECDAVGVLGVAVGRLLERAPPPVAPDGRSIRVCSMEAPFAAPANAPDFHVGQTHGWLLGGDAVVLIGRGRSIRVEGASIDAYVDDGLAPDSAAIEEIALVDLACAVFLAARAFGLWHVHAACVVSPELGPVLVVGQSGSGKSTTTLQLLAHGAAWLADDTVLLRVTGAGAEVYGVPRLFHVSPRTLELIPGLESACIPDRVSLLGKRCLDPEFAFPGRSVAGSVAPTVLVLPEVSGSTTTAVSVSHAEGLGALIEASTWVTVEGLAHAAEHLSALAALSGQCTAVRIRLAPDALGRSGRLHDALRAAADASRRG